MVYNSNEIFSIIQTIAATASKNEKQAMVAQYAQHESFLKVLRLAYDPFITYGVKALPSQQADAIAASQFSSNTWGLLDALSNRKLTGHAARDAIQNEINLLTPESAELLSRILRKNLRADFSESTINKAVKGTIPEFPYQRCSLLKEVDIDGIDWVSNGGVFSQVKADGMFANVTCENGLVTATSRQGAPIPLESFKGFEEAALARLKPGTQTHGEFLVVKNGKVLSRKAGNGVMNHVSSGGSFADDEVPLFLAWDQIPLTSVVPKGKCAIPYMDRFADVTAQITSAGGSPLIGLIPTRRVKSLAEARAHFAEMLASGQEGTVIKLPLAPWMDGTSKGQIKFKLEVDLDLEVYAIVPGKAGGKAEGRAGSLSCKSSDGLLRVDVTVKNEKMRGLVDANPEDWIGRIIPLIANELNEPGKNNQFYSLNLPRMAEASYRKDKVVADDLARIKLIFESAKMGIILEAA